MKGIPGPNRRPENANRFVRYDEDSKSYFVRYDMGRYIFDNTDGSYDIDIYGTDSIKSLDEIFTNTIQDEESEVCSSPFDVESLQAQESEVRTYRYEVEPQLRDVVPVATVTAAQHTRDNYSRMLIADGTASIPSLHYAREIEHGTIPSESLSLRLGQLGLLAERVALDLIQIVASQQTTLQGVNHDN